MLRLSIRKCSTTDGILSSSCAQTKILARSGMSDCAPNSDVAGNERQFRLPAHLSRCKGQLPSGSPEWRVSARRPTRRIDRSRTFTIVELLDRDAPRAAIGLRSDSGHSSQAVRTAGFEPELKACCRPIADSWANAIERPCCARSRHRLALSFRTFAKVGREAASRILSQGRDRPKANVGLDTNCADASKRSSVARRALTSRIDPAPFLYSRMARRKNLARLAIDPGFSSAIAWA